MSVVAVCLIAALFGFAGSMPLAGPVAVLVVSRGAQKEYTAAFRIGLGAAVAEGVYAFLAFWGFATFLARYPVVLPITHALTAIILIGLGGYFLVWKQQEDKPHSQRTRDERKRSTFLVGFTISALNPTLLATWSAAIAVLYSKQIVDMRGWMAAPFGASVMGGVIGWWVVLLWILRRFGDHVPKGALTWVVRVMGLFLIGVGIWSSIQLVMYFVHHGAA